MCAAGLSLLLFSIAAITVAIPRLDHYSNILPSARTIYIAQRTNTERREPQLLEIGQAKKVSSSAETPRQMKIVSYNIRWRGGDDLEKLIQFLRSDSEIGGARVIGLQEVDRNKKRTGNKNTIKVIAEELGMYYAWAAPPVAKVGLEEETGVAILSSYPLTDIQRLVLPHDGPGGRRRAALGATISAGNTRLRFYSVHAETRIAVDKKMDQMKAVLEDLGQQPKEMPTIVLGDFNTWEGSAVKRTFKLFGQEGFHTPFDDRSTFSRQILFFDLKLKLDWIWVRNLETKDYGINRKIDLSDHWPLWAIIEMSQNPKAGPTP